MGEGEGCAWTKKRVVRKRRAGLTAEGAEQAPEHVIEGMVGCKTNKRYIYIQHNTTLLSLCIFETRITASVLKQDPNT